jgi:hypothetical protein
MSGQDWTDKWLQKRSLLELWAGVIGTKAVEQQAEMSRRNQEAENRAVRRKLWRNDGGDQEGDDMGGTILGDVTIQQPAAPQRSGMSPLLAAALGVALPGVGIGGFLASQILNPADPAPVVEGVDTSVKIGLGKLSDYLPDQPAP